MVIIPLETEEGKGGEVKIHPPIFPDWFDLSPIFSEVPPITLILPPIVR